MNTYIPCTAFLLLLGSPSWANSEPIRFTFEGTVSAGFIDETALDGQSFLVIGTVVDEVDVGSFSCCGTFVAETAAFEFSSGETFVADPRSLIFSQQFSIVPGEGPTILNSVSGNPDFTNGISGSTSAGPLSYQDSHVPEAIGRIAFSTSGIGNSPQFLIQNEERVTLLMTRASFQWLTTESIPEPTSLTLLSFALYSLGAFRRRRMP